KLDRRKARIVNSRWQTRLSGKTHGFEKCQWAVLIICCSIQLDLEPNHHWRLYWCRISLSGQFKYWCSRRDVLRGLQCCSVPRRQCNQRMLPDNKCDDTQIDYL